MKKEAIICDICHDRISKYKCDNCGVDCCIDDTTAVALILRECDPEFGICKGGDRDDPSNMLLCSKCRDIFTKYVCILKGKYGKEYGSYRRNLTRDETNIKRELIKNLFKILDNEAKVLAI